MSNTTQHSSSNSMPKHAMPERVKLFLLALPFFILVLAFSYVPIFGWIYAFTNYRIGSKLSQLDFVGLSHFKEIFSSGSDFIQVLTNTFVLGFLGILLSPAPVVFAIMISQVNSRRYARLVQTITSFPNFISWVLMYAIIFLMFSSDSGVINKIISGIGLNGSINILANGEYAWLWITILGLGKGLGYSAIIYLAAIAGIDPELYDAADVDGAGRMAKIIHITVPHLLPTFFVLLLLSVANILNSGFDQYFVFQNPFTMDKLEVLDTYTYRLGIVNSQWSFSIAVGMFKSVVSIILLMTANYASKLVRKQSII